MDKNLFTLKQTAPELIEFLKYRERKINTYWFSLFSDILMEPMGKLVLIHYDMIETWQKIYKLISYVFNKKDQCREYLWVFSQQEIKSDSAYLVLGEDQIKQNAIEEYKTFAKERDLCIFLKIQNDNSSELSQRIWKNDFFPSADLKILGICKEDQGGKRYILKSSFLPGYEHSL